MTAQKIHIEPNTVQETLIIPLYGKKVCSELYPDFFYDASALALFDRIDYDWSRTPNNFFTRFGVVEVGMRMLDLACEIKDYLKTHPKAAVVNLGCGLDDQFPRVDNGSIHGYNLDYPDVIAARNEMMPPRDRETNLAVDLNDYHWMEKIDASNGVVLAASGVFYYFKYPQMQALLEAMAKAFPGGRLAFDTCNQKGLKLMLKTFIAGSDMSIDAFFSMNGPEDIRPWVPDAKITATEYMNGYQPLDKSMPWLYRMLGKVGDSSYQMRIVRIDF